MMFVSKKKWAELETKVNVLLSERNAEIKDLREEVKKYHDVKELLKPIKLKVKKAVYSNTADTVVIEYEAPVVTLEFDNGQQTTKNDFLISANLLGLVGLEDQMKIRTAITKATERRNDDQ